MSQQVLLVFAALIISNAAYAQNFDRTFRGNLTMNEIRVGQYEQERCSTTIRITATTNRLTIQHDWNCRNLGGGSRTSNYDRSGNDILLDGDVIGRVTQTNLELIDGFEDQTEADNLYMKFEVRRETRLRVTINWQSAAQMNNRIDLLSNNASGTLRER